MKNFKSIHSKSERKNTAKPHMDWRDSRTSKYEKNIHSSRWAKCSISIRNRWVICQYPFEECEAPATSVHHIKPAFQFPDDFFKEPNLIPLCEKHHRKADKQLSIDDINMTDYWKEKVNTKNLNKRGRDDTGSS